jgi:hypothetical protein
MNTGDTCIMNSCWLFVYDSMWNISNKQVIITETVNGK